MKLELVHYICAADGKSFDALEIPEFSYGDFLLRTKSGELAYLDGPNDETYDKVGQMLSSNRRTSGLSRNSQASVLQSIFGELACDPTPSGEFFSITGKPNCPACNSQEMESWEFTGKMVDVTVPKVSHFKWSSLSRIDMEARLTAILQNRLDARS